MCGFMNVQPSCSIYFIIGNLFSYLRMEYLGATAGKGVKACFFQECQTFFHRQFCFAEHIIQFYRCKSFYM